jgi:hypothetical protein
MCILQELHCRICEAADGDGGKTTFLFQLCREFQETLSKDKAAEEQEGEVEQEELGAPKPSSRYHCSGLKWPPEPNSPGYWICSSCLMDGYWEYRINADTVPERPLKCTRVRVRRRKVCVKFTGSRLTNSAANLPESFQEVLKPHEQEQVVALYDEDYGFRVDRGEDNTGEDIQEQLNQLSMSRLTKTDLCSMTISIPYCSLCKQPDVEYTEDADHHHYFPNTEWEPNEALVKWLLAQRSSGVFETAIKTAFIHRPCPTCIERETTLRQKVRDFLKKNGKNSFVVWLICNWIFSRGMGNFPMFDHAAFNHGYPDAEPPTVKVVMQMMASSWKRATCVSWEDLVELNPPVSCALPVVAHAELLINFGQWPSVKLDSPLILSDTLPSMVLDDSESSDGDEVTGRASPNAPRPKTWKKTLNTLARLGENEAIMASIQRESGLSQPDFDKAYSALKKVLAGASKPPIRGSIELNFAPTQNIESSSPEEKSASYKPKSRNQAPTRHQEQNVPPSILRNKISSQGSRRVAEGSRATTRADTPTSLPGQTRCSTTEPESLPATPEDHTRSQAVQGGTAKPAKHVRFEELDSFDISDDDLFGDSVSITRQSPEPSGDEAMPDADSSTMSSGGGEDEWQKCRMGAWHLCGRRGEDTASELVYLPLGISYLR